MIGPQYAAQSVGFGMPIGPMGNYTVADKVPADMLHLVDPHWYHFPPMNPLWHEIIACVMTILCIVSVCGNGMVIYIFSVTKELRTPSNLLVINLAFSDLCMMLHDAPVMVINAYYETWILGPFMCDLYCILGSLFGCTSIWTMTMIALDRYNVIVKGLSARPMTNGSATIRIICIYFFSLIWTLGPMFGWNRYVPEGNMTSCGIDFFSRDWTTRSYIICYSLFVYTTPLCTICYSYFYILKAVSAHEKGMREQAKKMNVASLRSGEQDKTSAECKLAKVALMTISLWFMAWTPYLVMNLSGLFKLTPISPMGTIWGSVFAKANTVYNPIVYGLSHPKYRLALTKKFPSLGCTGAAASKGSDTQSVASDVTTTVT